MEIVVEKLLSVLRPLLAIRPALWALLVAASGFALGLALRSDLPPHALDVVLFAWVMVIGLAAFNMRAAERRAARRRQEKLDRLYGRHR